MSDLLSVKWILICSVIAMIARAIVVVSFPSTASMLTHPIANYALGFGTVGILVILNSMDFNSAKKAREALEHEAGIETGLGSDNKK